MLKALKKWFSKGEADEQSELPPEEEAEFILGVDNVVVGVLSCKTGTWTFKYSPQFQTLSDIYNTVPGFPKLDKIYTSDTLWPFFRIRIPGLGQPAIRETLEKENIEPKNEVALLKRFGYKSISNPFTLTLG